MTKTNKRVSNKKENNRKTNKRVNNKRVSNKRENNRKTNKKTNKKVSNKRVNNKKINKKAGSTRFLRLGNKSTDFSRKIENTSKKCSIRDFIYYVYDNDKIFPQDDIESKKKCFLRGTFVFEDNNSQIFKLLEQNCNHTHSFWKTTHEEAKKKDSVVETLRLKSSLKEEKWKPIRDENNNPKHFYQYEHKFNPPIVFACDKDCRGENRCNTCEKCNESGYEDPKGVVFMYHFKTNFGSKYTLLKLEGHYSISLGHTFAAVNRYGFNKTGKTGYTTTRREDCMKDKKGCQLIKKNNCYRLDENNALCSSISFADYHNNKFYYSLKDTNKETNFFRSLRNYDEYVRTGDEFFIPQQITDYLLTDFKNKMDTSRIATV